MNDRNADILEHIIRYCKEIMDARERFGNTLEELQSDIHFRNSVAMCILQIGELAGHFSDDFKAQYNKVPWQKIKGMRNITAHHYGKIDTNILFTTISERIPELHIYCENLLQQYTESEQETKSGET